MPWCTPVAAAPAARAGGDAGAGGWADVAAVLLLFMSHFSYTLAPIATTVGKGKPSLCTLDKREQVQYLPREGPAPAGTRASRRCGQERAAAASPTRTGELPPAGCSHLPPWAAFPPPDAWHRQHPYVVRGLDPGQRSPRLPLALLPCLGEQGQGQAPADARQGEERGRVPWEAWRREHQRRAVPKGHPLPPLPPLCKAPCKHAATAPVPRTSPEGGRRARPSWEAASSRALGAWGWVRGAGCVPGGLGACPGLCPRGWGRLGWVEGAHRDQLAAASMP